MLCTSRTKTTHLAFENYTHYNRLESFLLIVHLALAAVSFLPQLSFVLSLGDSGCTVDAEGVICFKSDKV